MYTLKIYARVCCAQVWSADSDVTHDAATHQLVMKGQKWVTGDDMLTTLTDKEGEQQASLHMTRTAQRTILKASRPRAATATTAAEVGVKKAFFSWNLRGHFQYLLTRPHPT